MIAVIDGATDGSLECVDKWRQRFPNNIYIIEQENGGLSAARNTGLSHATGEWVTFIDPDDFISLGYFNNVDKLIESPIGASLSLVSCNLIFYDESTGKKRDKHPLRFRFSNGNQIIRADSPGRFIQLSVNSVFFRASLLRPFSLAFDTRCRPSFEDAHLVNRFLLRVPNTTIGICPRARYYYRKRSDKSSLLDGAWTSAHRYDGQIRYGYLALIDDARRIANCVPEWIQRTILYDLMWYFRKIVKDNRVASFLTPEQRRVCSSLFFDVFNYIDESTIMDFELAGIGFFEKVGMLGLFKKAEPPHQIVYAEKYEPQSDLVKLRYFTHSGTVNPRYLIDDKTVVPTYFKTVKHQFLGQRFVTEVIAWVGVGGGKTISITIDGRAARVSVKGKEYGLSALLSIMRSNLETRASSSKRLLESVRVRGLQAFHPRGSSKYAAAWLFLDRDTQADDNAEHLYRYVVKNHKNVNAYFLIRPSSPDWGRLEGDGFRLIAFGSRDHRTALVNARFVISSHAANYVHNFLRKRQLSALCTYQYVFLQHGVIKDDVSAWINSKPIDLFVTSTPEEYASISGNDSPYVFSQKEVVLTGLPRHDALLSGVSRVLPSANRHHKRVLFMPTWRDGIVGSLLEKTDEREVNPDFAQTDLAKAWRELLHAPRLQELAGAGSVRFIFFPHANLTPYSKAFGLPEYVETLHHSECSFQDLLRSADVFITDYTSVAFDVALLLKPIIYYHFDNGAIFEKDHTCVRGYFSYENDGFGPVCYSSSSVVDALNKILENGCVAEPLYRRRMEGTLPFRDGRNCERVFQRISELTLPQSAKSYRVMTRRGPSS